MTQSIAKLVQILRDEQTFLANSREQCADDEGERWDRIESIICYLVADAAGHEKDSRRLDCLIGHAWDFKIYNFDRETNLPGRIKATFRSTTETAPFMQQKTREWIDDFMKGCEQ